MSDREGVSPEGEAPEPSQESSIADAAAPPDASATPDASAAPDAAEPAEPALRADPSVREFDVPFDTGELRSLPTGQLLVVHRPEIADEASDAVEEQTQRRVYSWIAAIVGTIGAAASLFVGWMLPLSIAAIVFGVLGLRREEEGRTTRSSSAHSRTEQATLQRATCQIRSTSSAMCRPSSRVSTIVALSSPRSFRRVRRAAGSTSTPRFLISRVPMRRAASA
jgi:hypothetical protein